MLLSQDEKAESRFVMNVGKQAVAELGQTQIQFKLEVNSE